jgi:DNA-binding transcriptional MerR regulator
MPELFLLSDVARLLDCKPHQIVYLLTSRQVAEPALRIGGRRVFTQEDMERLEVVLEQKQKGKSCMIVNSGQ